VGTQDARYSEVSEIRIAIGVQQDIAWFQIAVEHVFPVGIV